MKDKYSGITEEEAKYEIARLVARWILGGCKGAEKPEVQDWLIDNGYAWALPLEYQK